MTEKKNNTKEKEAKVAEQIEESDRVKLHELWLEMVALNNAVSAMQAEVGKLQAEISSHHQVIKQYTEKGVKMDVENQQAVEAVKKKYNIPEDYKIDSKTGKIYPPDAPLPQSDTPLITRRG